MPLIDLPLEELNKYKGINPRPDDFDEYWTQALEEMRNTDPQVELIPAEFQAPYAECFDLYFTGVRGARVHAKYLRPRNNVTPHPAILHFHGYSMSSGEWYDKLPWAALGYSIVAMDVRGQGGASEEVGGAKGTTLNGHIIRGLDDAPENMLFRHIFLDTAQLALIVMDLPEVDESRVGVTGWSQGGALSIACAALEPRIRKAVTVYPFLSDYQRVWEMDLAKDAYAELRSYFRHFDPQHKREKEIFTKLGYIDIQNLAPRVRAEVMFGVGLMDTVCPPSTQFAAINKMETTVQYEIYPDYAHEHLPGMNDKAFQFFSTM